MADGEIKIAGEAGEWISELEGMKKINFFPYLKVDLFEATEAMIEPKKENCAIGNHCGQC
ncbi:MAG: hypothetical protein HW401_849 [Parcubacteria group bacterium]|nr:hypothetical protein [Parcubacteria group bacterium]